MDFCRNISVSGGLPATYQPEQQLLSPSCSKLGSLDDLFSGHSMEEGDVNMEWLSIFVEDCLSSTGNCLPPTPLMPSNPQSTTSNAAGTTNTAADPNVKKTHLENSLSMHKFVVPGKARSKRKRSQSNKTLFQGTTPLCWSQQYPTTSDPPLLHQAHWLADSELILPKKSTSPNSTKTKHELILPMKGTSPNSSRSWSREEVLLPKKGTSPKSSRSREEVILPMKSTSPNSSRNREVSTDGEQEVNKEEGSPGQVGQHGQGRRCTHCLSQKTPQWRAGPQGPKTLCNACGVRYKSGRLLPEYRPAKSPTFLSYKHSNSHKKVLEMRMSLLSSSPNSSSS